MGQRDSVSKWLGRMPGAVIGRCQVALGKSDDGFLPGRMAIPDFAIPVLALAPTPTCNYTRTAGAYTYFAC